jgi:hypothetical protein
MSRMICPPRLGKKALVRWLVWTRSVQERRGHDLDPEGSYDDRHCGRKCKTAVLGASARFPAHLNSSALCGFSNDAPFFLVTPPCFDRHEPAKLRQHPGQVHCVFRVTDTAGSVGADITQVMTGFGQQFMIQLRSFSLGEDPRCAGGMIGCGPRRMISGSTRSVLVD